MQAYSKPDQEQELVPRLLLVQAPGALTADNRKDQLLADTGGVDTMKNNDWAATQRVL